jgi:hypothetical protein
MNQTDESINFITLILVGLFPFTLFVSGSSDVSNTINFVPLLGAVIYYYFNYAVPCVNFLSVFAKALFIGVIALFMSIVVLTLMYINRYL